MKLLSQFAFFCTISCFGCSKDPILERAAELEKENSSAKSSKNIVDKSNTTSNPQPGKPKEPKPVQVKPVPVKPKPEPQQSEKSKITISGSISIVGDGDWENKPIRIDVFDGDQRALEGPRPKVISTKRISKYGDFSLSVEQVETGLWIGAYCDVDGDGRPGPKDPSGWYANNPVSSKSDRSGISIVLEIPKEESTPQDPK